MDVSTLIFFFLAAFLIVASLLVVFLRSVVHSAMALVAALFIISIFFIILQAPMVGVLQVLVYAGAIMVLFLFVIMFLNPAPQQQRGAWLGFSGLLALLLGGVLVAMFTETETAADPIASTEIFGGPEMLARSLFNDFVLPFEIASVLLLVAIVGAVVLAKRGS